MRLLGKYRNSLFRSGVLNPLSASPHTTRVGFSRNRVKPRSISAKYSVLARIALGKIHVGKPLFEQAAGRFMSQVVPSKVWKSVFALHDALPNEYGSIT